MASSSASGNQKAAGGGFTLIEVILVTALISIIVAIAAPFYASAQKNGAVDLATDILVQDLYQAQIYSRSESHGCGWGVAINNPVITLFCGNTYASRNSAYDFNYTIPASISTSGTTEIDYSALYGLPSSPASINLSSSNKSVTISVNSKGMVDY
ncbi:MAG TPA: type II secretion system protein [Candidatus Saccharimonadales bacterium]|nr:type II secretion system protein [Candidatus Saccharimonadales bacterium]